MSELYFAYRNNEIDKAKKYLEELSGADINRRESNGSTALHVACYYGNEDIVKLLLQSGASQAIRNTRFDLTVYQEARSHKIRKLFERPDDSDRFICYLSTNEWTLVDIHVAEASNKFRDYLKSIFDKSDLKDMISTISEFYIEDTRQISSRYVDVSNSLGKTIYGELLTSALIDRKHTRRLSYGAISNKNGAIIDWFLTKAVDEVDPIFIVQAYTSTTNFYQIVNKHLSLRLLDNFKWDISNAFLRPFRRLVIDVYDEEEVAGLFAAIFIHCPLLEPYSFVRQCFRGMLISEDDLKIYHVGSLIMNKTFLSASKQQAVAKLFAGEGQTSNLRQTPDQKNIQWSALCTYNIKSNRSALQIESISEVQCEEEVLIMPL
ncbi:unnamed protein product [Didymodactylos carnosus]|uniref:Ankyrin repeat protein n=1 Tax=Didymodactylos carnosus TaxID=1234261 RepID=A0A814KRW9_9BILA|nr:unnamed protein product [Didymodactylos carnosus]CAF1182423.1 unnamed protein product [Didymodactylos carnosus]CAF3824370.1 unnamed protein product [Didymodactylos carnosus]CAF3993741.1 unnamed protein product [Didymodactylos carnosus]